MQNNIIELPFSKKKIFFLSFVSLAFVALGLWILLSDRPKTGVVELAGYASIAFFGFAYIVMIIKLFDKKMGLIIDDKYLIINPSSKQETKILLADIAEFEEVKIFGNKMIAIKLNNPQDYINAQKNMFKQSMMIKSMDMCGTPYSIVHSVFPVSHKELIELLQERIKTKHSN